MDRRLKKRQLRLEPQVQNFTICLTPCPRSWFGSRRSAGFTLLFYWLRETDACERLRRAEEDKWRSADEEKKMRFSDKCAFNTFLPDILLVARTVILQQQCVCSSDGPVLTACVCCRWCKSIRRLWICIWRTSSWKPWSAPLTSRPGRTSTEGHRRSTTLLSHWRKGNRPVGSKILIIKA